MEKGTKVGQECDECGKHIAKICRVYKGNRYCAICYARVFKRRMCPGCGNFARLLKSDPSAVCIKCQTSKPCARCGKTDYAVGKITPYGPVCNSCAPHFREPEPCELCGSKSTRLTRVSRFDHEHRVCPKCARADYDTCQACGCHRQLHVSADGRKLCKTCLEKGDVPCQKCGEPMPAGYGKQCQACYWKGLLEKRIRMDCAAFSVPRMAAHFEAFGQWLGKEVGEHKAAITIHRYLDFFREIESQWGSVPAYEALLGRYGTLALRRKELPMRFLAQCGLVTVNEEAKQEHSDRRRIAAQLERLPAKSRAREILEAYQRHMVERVRVGTSTIRSVRLAMNPAACLLLEAQAKERQPPMQNDLVNYLSKAPGQRAAVSGFVGFLRERYSAELALPPSGVNATKKQHQKLEAQLLALLQSGGDGKMYSRELLGTALAYFHGLPKIALDKATCERAVEPQEAGVIFRLDGLEYWLPENFIQLVQGKCGHIALQFPFLVLDKR